MSQQWRFRAASPVSSFLGSALGAFPPLPAHERFLTLLCLNSTAAPGETKDCPLDPYMIVHDKCTFVDQQTIKLQEAPDMVPVGELPRHLILSCDRFVPFFSQTLQAVLTLYSTDT
jgi:hypothetical protein